MPATNGNNDPDMNYTKFNAVNVVRVCSSSSGFTRGDQTTFVLDNAAATHTCGVKRAFTSFSDGQGRMMTWFNGAKCTEDGHGTVKLMIPTDTSLSVDACYVNGAMNLLSQRRLFMDHGLRATVKKDQNEMVLASDDGGVKLTFVLDPIDGLYKMTAWLLGALPAVWSTSRSDRTSLTLWHARLAHAHVGTVRTMARSSAVPQCRRPRTQAVVRMLHLRECEEASHVVQQHARDATVSAIRAPRWTSSSRSL